MILKTTIVDARFPMNAGAGSDAIHGNPVYSYAITQLHDDSGLKGSGFAFTLGEGNELVCKAAQFYAEKLKGNDIEDLMADFGNVFNKLSNDQQFRWLGPHKGVIHLGLASVTNACYDLWAKKRGIPLWKLLIDLEPELLINTLDFSYLEDEFTKEQALDLLKKSLEGGEERAKILEKGYPGYDTSIGWFNYEDEKVRDQVYKSVASGFTAMKLKVGSKNEERDIRRSFMVREAAGDSIKIMLDANQQWTLPQAIKITTKLQAMNPFWIEEPTHPDDILAHKTIAQVIAPTKLALGEHVPNRIIFKNYLQSKCAGFIQADALRLGGVSEFITVSLLCKKYGIPVVPHVGDMGQLHQHLVLFNHIALGHEVLFLEHIPHLQKHFLQPAEVANGVYKIPNEPGCSCDLKEQ